MTSAPGATTDSLTVRMLIACEVNSFLEWKSKFSKRLGRSHVSIEDARPAGLGRRYGLITRSDNKIGVR